MKRARPSASGVTRRPKKKGKVSGRTLPANLRSFGHETKAVDLLVNNSALNATGTVTALNLMSAGTSFFNRIGRRVELKNLTFSGQIVPLRTVAAQEYARIVVFYDRQTNGAAPAVGDVLLTVNQSGTATTTSLSGINLNNRDRFRIFIDERITLPSQTVTAGQVTTPGWVDPVKTTFNIKRFVKLDREVTQFKADSTPGVVGDISTGGLFCLTLSDAAAGSEGFQFQFESRLRYNDI